MNAATRAAYNYLINFRHHRLKGASHYTALCDVTALDNAVQLRRQAIIHAARNDGWTWAEIGEALNITADTARRRYGI